MSFQIACIFQRSKQKPLGKLDLRRAKIVFKKARHHERYQSRQRAQSYAATPVMVQTVDVSCAQTAKKKKGEGEKAYHSKPA